jgi:hypothetical protein
MPVIDLTEVGARLYDRVMRRARWLAFCQTWIGACGLWLLGTRLIAEQPTASTGSPAAAATSRSASGSPAAARSDSAAPTRPGAPASPSSPSRAATTVRGLPVQSVFHIEKSENKNQVHYAVQVDAGCHPISDHPLYGYWRDLEIGPRAVSPLLRREQVAYGLTEPRFVRSTPEGGQIRIGLRGFPTRPLTVETYREGAACVARGLTTIQNQPAVLLSIYVKIGFLFSVEYALLRGLRLRDGARLEEKVSD